MDSPWPAVKAVRCTTAGIVNSFNKRGITSLIIRPLISCGTPGNEIKIFLSAFFNTPSLVGWRVNHIPGAEPLALCNTVQTSGTSACFRFRSNMGPGRRYTFSNKYFTWFNTFSSTIILPPKYLHSNGLVISSAVGPSPPVMIMSCDCLASSSKACHISSHTSPTATLRRTQMPILFNSWAINALLVSIVWPINSSSPMVIIEALINAGIEKIKDRYRNRFQTKEVEN